MDLAKYKIVIVQVPVALIVFLSLHSQIFYNLQLSFCVINYLLLIWCQWDTFNCWSDCHVWEFYDSCLRMMISCLVCSAYSIWIYTVSFQEDHYCRTLLVSNFLKRLIINISWTIQLSKRWCAMMAPKVVFQCNFTGEFS